MQQQKTIISEAAVDWNDETKPSSLIFDGCYFDSNIGIPKNRYIFLEQNLLSAQRSFGMKHSFTIGETGFGAGINFLITAKLWLKYSNSQKKMGALHFVSVEKFPLSKRNLQRILSLVPELSELGKELIDVYPPPIPGIHKLYFKNRRIVLTLMYGDGYDMLSSIRNSDHPFFQRKNNPTFDAWFLDGFSPDKNKDMWSEKLFKVVANLSNSGTIFVASTSEITVRRRLEKCGFDIKDTSKTTHPNNILIGKFTTPCLPSIPKDHWIPSRFNSQHKAPWYLTPKIEKPEKAIVIGGGIAGCSTARALAERGISVTLVERHKKIGQEASGNAQGIIYPKLSSSISMIARFGVSALLAASRYYDKFLDSDTDATLGNRCGVLILPKSISDQENFKSIALLFPNDFVRLLNSSALEQQAGVPLSNTYGLFFPELGWISPPKVCASLIQHPLISVCTAEVEQIDFRPPLKGKSKVWVALDHANNIIGSAPVIVVACAFDSSKFNQTNHLPLTKVRGQTTVVPETEETHSLDTILCGDGYILPALDGMHTLGATYSLSDDQITNRLVDHKTNIRQIGAIDNVLGKNFIKINENSLEGRTSFRCATPDFLPIAGPAPKLCDYITNYKLMQKNARAHIPVAGSSWEGLYLNIGHGSRGLSYAPMCAELVAGQICNEIPPLELDLRQALHPGRFIIRDIKRGKL